MLKDVSASSILLGPVPRNLQPPSALAHHLGHYVGGASMVLRSENGPASVITVGKFTDTLASPYSLLSRPPLVFLCTCGLYYSTIDISAVPALCTTAVLQERVTCDVFPVCVHTLHWTAPLGVQTSRSCRCNYPSRAMHKIAHMSLPHHVTHSYICVFLAHCLMMATPGNAKCPICEPPPTSHVNCLLDVAQHSACCLLRMLEQHPRLPHGLGN